MHLQSTDCPHLTDTTFDTMAQCTSFVVSVDDNQDTFTVPTPTVKAVFGTKFTSLLKNLEFAMIVS